MSAAFRRCGPWAAAVIAFSLAARAQAEFLPVRGKLDPRIRTVIFERDQVYRLYGFVGYALDLVFAPRERFVGLSAGDPEALIYSAHGNVLTLRPKALSVATNITVTTSRHRYYFAYTSSDHSPRNDVHVMYAVRFIYPESASKAHGPTPAERVNTALTRAEQAPPVNRDYWYCGSAALRPIAASDDGIETRLTFGARRELPAIFVLNADGSESLVNFSMHHGVVVIERIARRFVLRRGKLEGLIVNKGFAGAGERLASGTISPGVQRVVRSVRP